MEFFRKYKTPVELLPGFLLEKEISIQRKSYSTYSGQLPVFTDWLKEHGYDNLTIRKITPEIISDFFYYLGKDKGLDRPTCEKYFLNVRQLFKYGQKRKELEDLPFDLVVFPRKKKDQGADVIQDVDLKPLLEEIKRADP
jgi:site-specific recombinase XerD